MNFGDSVPKAMVDQTDISTGIGPTGTDTPAPKDLAPHSEQQEQLHSLKEPLSRPPGALFQVGSGMQGGSGTIPDPISEEQPAKRDGLLSKIKDKLPGHRHSEEESVD